MPDDTPQNDEGITSTITQTVADNDRQHIRLDSSWLRSCYYDAASQTLSIETTRQAYTLHGVPPDEFVGLISAASPGSYFNDNLKGKY
jgi:hypothetical protein